MLVGVPSPSSHSPAPSPQSLVPHERIRVARTHRRRGDDHPRSNPSLAVSSSASRPDRADRSLRLNSPPLRTLAEAPALREAFPGQTFRPLPPLEEPPERMFPELLREAIAALPPYNLVVVAVPDHFHDPVIRAALEHHQHVLTVKPLVLQYAQAAEIERIARERGLFVGVEYHKRFDRRSLEAAAPIPPRTLRPVPLRRGQTDRALLLPPLEFPELVHEGEQRPVHLHRLPLRGPGLFHHGPAAGRGFASAAWRGSSPTARSAISGRPPR